MINPQRSVLLGRSKEEKPKKIDNSSVAKLFEEIKVMYQDLPSRVEGQLRDNPKRKQRKRHIRADLFRESMHDIIHFSHRQGSPILGAMILISQYKEELPWVYDVLREACVAEKSGKMDLAMNLIRSLEATDEAPLLRHILDDEFRLSKEAEVVLHEFRYVLHTILKWLSGRTESMGQSVKNEAKWSDIDRKRAGFFGEDSDHSQAPDDSA